MSEFSLYLQLGFQHIADWAAYDHMVFLLALTAKYKPEDWKKLLWLISAFTVGHTITLALSTLEIVSVPSEIIEFLIPLTIFITCIYNLFSKDVTSSNSKKRISLTYSITVIFGLIHGLGFSNYLKAILSKGDSLVQPLLAFNLGLEFGQLIIVGFLFILLVLSQNIFTLAHREWNVFLSGCAAGISIILMSNTAFW